MSFTSGNVKSINEFMDVMAAYAVTNESWVILDGAENQSDSGAFPLSSRYYRLDFDTPASGTIVSIGAFDMRATVSGADLGMTEPNSYYNSGSQAGEEFDDIFDGSSATYWESSVEDFASFYYDFGADQLIRELKVTAWNNGTSGGSRMPTRIRLYRSEDGFYWDRVQTWTGLSWSPGETKLLALPADLAYFSSSTLTGGVRRPCKYVLQGPGYDAERRVYVGFEIIQDFTDGNQGFRFQGYTGYDGSLDFDNQLNALPFSDTPLFIIDNSGEDIDYWLYVNSQRITACLRSAAGDYAQFYVGFVSSFANPDQHPNPLFLGGTTPNIGTDTVTAFLLHNEADSRNAAFWDPGTNGAKLLDYKGDWLSVNNNREITSLGRYPITSVSDNECFIQPWHFGTCTAVATFGDYTYPQTGNNFDVNGDHFLKRQIISLQDELPVFDAIVSSPDYGHVGALQGVIGVSGAGALVPEQTITVGGVTYRIFPKRTLRDDAQYVGIAEL
jgi:hypothetical protein